MPSSAAMTSGVRRELFDQRISPLLKRVYEPVIVPTLLEQLFGLVEGMIADDISENFGKWSQENILLITYGDSICNAQEEKPLKTLARFLSKSLNDVITGVHILPFTPFTSDDGFAVQDYMQVNPKLGDWKDIEAIAQDFDLMVDMVINHISSQHEWFQQFRQGQKPGCDYFITVDPGTDVSGVVRPRSTHLLVATETVNGIQQVWATFSADQIDVNFANPDVLLEFVRVIRFYVQAGAKYVRLDAIGYLWKELERPAFIYPRPMR